ncbi:MAG: SGNH/GDSL hydrolase family protein [Oscillospiraceae bacterium]
MMLIEKNSLVLLQGDSVTDAQRDYADDTNMGFGYANILTAMMKALHPEANIRFLNRGISGNRVRDLSSRWEADCLSIKPDWLSILIGINDCWRRYDSSDPTTAQAFYEEYRRLLTRTKESLPDTKIILMDPFVLHINPERASWREDLDPKIQAVRALASEFKTMYIPLDGMFAAASIQSAPDVWAADGVHPTQAGSALIASAWLRAVDAM